METEIELNWRLGKKTAEFLAKIARSFAARIRLSAGRRSADVKNPDEMMALGPPKTNNSYCYVGAGLPMKSKVRLAFHGSDAPEALQAFWPVFAAGERHSKCPHERCPDIPALLELSPSTIRYICDYGGHSWSIARKSWDCPPLYLSMPDGPFRWPGAERLTPRECLILESRTLMDSMLGVNEIYGDLNMTYGWLD